MAKALNWSGYFALITGVIVALYIISSMKVIDVDTVDLVVKEAPHPYRWAFALFTLAVTTPIGLLSVAAAEFLDNREESSFDARKRKEEMQKGSY